VIPPELDGGASGGSPDAGPLPDGGTASALLRVPSGGQLYHGVYPGSANGEEDGVAPADVDSYEAATGRTVAWVYFSQEWSRGRTFPTSQAEWIRARGSVPFIRLMLRSTTDQYVAEPFFTLDAILRGDFDSDFQAWADGAKVFGTPVVVEWGTEVNGMWFSWNGQWNGGAGVGPAKFRDAYRHIVQQIRSRGATNLTFVFHFNDEGEPAADWNAPANYYPGDDVIDWIGFSIYGTMSPLDTRCMSFTAQLDKSVQSTLQTISTKKPLFVFEMATSGGNAGCVASDWARTTFEALLSGRWPAVAGFAWWNEHWRNDSNPLHDSDMRVQTVPNLGTTMQAELTGSHAAQIVDRPLLNP
jgi:hypothetical protein